MQLYLSHSGNFDYQSELYIPLKESSLVTQHGIFFPHDPENINTKAKDIIANYDILVAEVSYPSTGQGIEIGWASAHDTPIICLYRTGSKPSGSLRFISETFLEYSSPQDLVQQLADWVQSQ